MKTTQAWGWLAAGVLALGLNGFYQDGGAQWAHQIVGRVASRSGSVLALASGRADQFLSEAGLVTARTQTSSCRLATALARLQTRVARGQSDFARFEGLSARQEAALARLQANRARMQAKRTKSAIATKLIANNTITLSKPRFEMTLCPAMRSNKVAASQRTNPTMMNFCFIT